VVVVVVVDPLVGADGCGGRVVVVVDDERDGLVVATVVVATRARRCGRGDFRLAEATGTETASTTVTAVNTTTNVRSLRLILSPLSDRWEARRSPVRTRDRVRARREQPCVALAGPGDRALGSSRPADGARTCTITANPCLCDVAAISG
jgi:hypothetical protein